MLVERHNGRTEGQEIRRFFGRRVLISLSLDLLCCSWECFTCELVAGAGLFSGWLSKKKAREGALASLTTSMGRDPAYPGSAAIESWNSPRALTTSAVTVPGAGMLEC